LGSALNFIDDGAIQSLNETHGISPRGLKRGFIVECHEGHIACGDLLGERSFSGLPGTGEEHDASV
jgi:hypothetical protein